MTDWHVAPAAVVEEYSAVETIAGSIRTIWRQKGLVCWTMIVVVAATAAVLHLVPSYYTSEAEIIIDPQHQSIVDTVESSQTKIQDQEATQNQVQVLRSRSLAERVITTLRLDEDPEFNTDLRTPGLLVVLTDLGRRRGPSNAELTRGRTIDEFLSNLNVSIVNRTRVVRVGFSASTPEKAFKIVETLVATFLEDQVSDKYQVSGQARDWLDIRLAELSKTLASIDQSIDSVRRVTGINNSDEISLVTQQFFTVSTEYALARSKRAEDEIRLQSVENNLLSWTPDKPIVSSVVISPLIQSLREQETRAEAELAQLTTTQGASDPRVISLETRIDELRNRIKTELESTVESLRSEVASARARETALEQQFGELRNRLELIGENELRLRALWSERENIASVYDEFNARSRVLEGRQDIQQPDARVISAASYPVEASFPRTYFALALAFVMSFFLGIAFVYLRETFDRTFRNADRLQTVLGIPVVTVIPATPNSETPARASSTATPSPMARDLVRAIRALWLKLNLTYTDDPMIVMVASARPNDQRSQVARVLVEFAILAGRRVLLIASDDGDMNPSGPAPRETTLGPANWEEIAHLIKPIPGHETAKSHMLPMVSLTDGSVGILDQQSMGPFFLEMSSEYDVIVIDAPPINESEEALLFCPFVNSAILVVRWAATPREAVRSALQSLRAMGLSVVGAAFSDVNLERYKAYND